MSDDDNKCPICLDTLSCDDDTHTLDCGHTFHTSCIVESLRRVGPACPMCRSQPASKTEAVFDAPDPASAEDHSSAVLQTLVQSVAVRVLECFGLQSVHADQVLSVAMPLLGAAFRGSTSQRQGSFSWGDGQWAFQIHVV